jgi:hypothetical protein
MGYEKPMALKRTSIIIGALVLVLVIVRIAVGFASTGSPREQLSAQRLASDMGHALLKTKSAAFFNVATQSGPASTFFIDSQGNYEDVQWSSDAATTPTFTQRTVNGRVFYLTSERSIVTDFARINSEMSNSAIRTDAKQLGGHWFTTGLVASTKDNSPADPSTLQGLFSRLHFGFRSEFIKQSTNTDEGVAVIPLVTNNTTWFIPTRGSFLPVQFTSYTSGSIVALFDASSAILTFNKVAPLATPSNVMEAPSDFANSWNTLFHPPMASHLTPIGLISFAQGGAS